MKGLKYLIAIAFLIINIRGYSQQPFTAGNLVVYRVGDGTATLDGKMAKVYLDEYTSDGVLVQSVLMPTATNGANSLLTVQGTDVNAGMLSLSSNGKYLVVPGGNSAIGNTSFATANVIGLVDFNGQINTATVITDAPEGNVATRAAVSEDGSKIWFGVFGGLRYTTAGSSTSVKLNGSSSQARVTGLAIADGQLYETNSSAPFVRQIGTGLPGTCCPTFTGLPGMATDIQGTGQFAFADLDPSIPGADVLYQVSGSGIIDPSVGIRKFSLVGGVWTANGSVGGDVLNSWYLGLTVRTTGNTVTIFATRQGSNSNTIKGGELVKLVDNSGYNGTLTGTPTVIATVATANAMAFRGVATVPQSAPFTAGNLVVYRVGDGTATLDGKMAKVYLDEYTSDGVLVQSVLMPTATNGANSLLTVQGTDVNAGMLSLSSNGKYLVVPGGNSAIGNTSFATANVIGLVDFNGQINTATVITDAPEGNVATRAAVSEDGSKIWFGVFGGLRYTTAGSSTSVKLNGSSSQARVTGLAIADGQLYETNSSAPFVRQIGTGLPGTCCPTFTGLPGMATDIQGTGQFAFADLDPSIPGADVLYQVSGSGIIDPSVGIRKFSLVGGVWTANGSVGGDVLNSWYLGLTVRTTGNTVTIFATRQGSNSNTIKGGELVKLVDNSGYNGTLTGTPTVIATVATANAMAFRGVAKAATGCAAVINLSTPDISSSQAKIVWTAPNGGGNYEYAVTTSSTPPVSGTATTNTSVSVTGLTNATTYYAYVRTVCSKLSVSEWSAISFVTGCKAPASPFVKVTISDAGLVEVKWNKVFGAMSYEYSISTSLIPPGSGTATGDTSLSITNLNAVTQYYIHVRSNCGANVFSSWTTKVFTTGCFMPAINITVLPKNASATWNQISNAAKYEYALTNNPVKPLSGSFTTDTVYSPVKINEGSAYFFHVRSVCLNGAVSDWATVRFDVQGLVAYPSPVRDVLHVKLNGITNPSGELAIGDVMGRMVYRVRLTSNTITVDTRSWAAGVYLIRFKDQQQQYTFRVIKQ